MSGHDDEGSAVLEVVLLTPVLILILAAVIGGARVTLAHQRVDAAAAQAARAASTAASPSRHPASAGVSGKIPLLRGLRANQLHGGRRLR